MSASYTYEDDDDVMVTGVEPPRGSARLPTKAERPSECSSESDDDDVIVTGVKPPRGSFTKPAPSSSSSRPRQAPFKKQSVHQRAKVSAHHRSNPVWYAAGGLIEIDYDSLYCPLEVTQRECVIRADRRIAIPSWPDSLTYDVGVVTLRCQRDGITRGITATPELRSAGCSAEGLIFAEITQGRIRITLQSRKGYATILDAGFPLATFSHLNGASGSRGKPPVVRMRNVHSPTDPPRLHTPCRSTNNVVQPIFVPTIIKLTNLPPSAAFPLSEWVEEDAVCEFIDLTADDSE